MPKEMIISSSPHETKVAVLEEDQLVEVYFERDTDVGLVGSIYKGRVNRVLPGMQSAFVDIGLERDAFLYVSDFFFEDQEEYDKVFEEAEARAIKVTSEEPGAPRETALPAATDLIAPPHPSEAPEEGTAAPASEAAADETQPTEAPVAAPDVASERSEHRRFDPSRGRRRRRRGRAYNERRYDEPKFRPRPEAAGEAHTFELLPGESLAKYGHLEPAEAPLETSGAVESAVSQSREDTAGSGSSLQEADALDEGPVEVASSSPEGKASDSPVSRATEPEEPIATDAYNAPAAATEPPEHAAGKSPLAAPSASGAGSVPPAAAGEIPAVTWEHQKQTFARPAFAPKADQVPATTTPESIERQAVTPEEAPEEQASHDTALEESLTHEPADTSAEMDVNESAQKEAEFPENGEETAPHGETVEAAAEIDEEASPEVESSSDSEATEQERAPGEEAPVVSAPAEERTYTLREPHQRPRFAPRRRRGRRGTGQRTRHERRESRPGNHQPMQISELLKEGQEILVQIAKEPLGTKGARITSHIALPGRYLVYMPTINHIGVSRKINSEEERLRLRNVILENKGSLTGGFIVRTAGQGRSEDEFKADLKFLATLWNDIRTKAERLKAPALLHRDLDLVQRLLRDALTPDFKSVRVDNETDYERALEFVDRCQPTLVGKVKLYTRDTPIFEEFGVQQEIEKGLKPKVWLKSGGYIVINQTEALVAIDVNTGKYVGKTNRLEDTIVKTNIDAVHEIVRQIRLRDLGGIIVIDFIDMDERKNRQKVVQALEEALRSDRAPTKVISFHDFGLVAITRKRVKQSLERTLCEPCNYCSGSGWIKSINTVCYEILAEARKMARQIEGDVLTLRVNPDVAKALKSRDGRLLSELESMTKKDVIIKSDPTVHQERFEIF